MPNISRAEFDKWGPPLSVPKGGPPTEPDNETTRRLLLKGFPCPLTILQYMPLHLGMHWHHWPPTSSMQDHMGKVGPKDSGADGVYSSRAKERMSLLGLPEVVYSCCLPPRKVEGMGDVVAVQKQPSSACPWLSQCPWM